MTVVSPAAELENDDIETELLEASVPFASSGRRFDQALAELFPEFSRSRLTEWIKSGDALLDGRIGKPKESVRGGEAITLLVRRETQTDALPENIPLDIVYQDDEVLVVNKQAGLVVHPGAGNPRGTLVNGLLHFDLRLAELPRAGIVHRLDKDTSGLMVIARTLRAHAGLVEQLSAREVHRQYLAVVQGTMVAGTTIKVPIGRHPTDRIRQAVVKEGQGRDAVTHYRVREKFRSHTLVECRLETGRTHQIRVHMAHIRHQIVGDPLYGGAFKLPKAATETLVTCLHGFKRQALHAESLTFKHPATGQDIASRVDMPADMFTLCNELRADTAAFMAAQKR